MGGTPECGGRGAGGLRRSQAGGGALAAVCLGGRGAGGFRRGGAGKALCRAGRRVLPGRGEPEPSFRAAGSRARAGLAA